MEKTKEIGDDLFLISENDRKGIINAAHEYILPCEYSNIVVIKDNLFLIEKDGLWGAKNIYANNKTDNNDNTINISCKYSALAHLTSSYFSAEVGTRVKRYYVLNGKGQYHKEAERLGAFDDALVYFKDTLAIARKNGLYGLVDFALGRPIIPYIYEKISIRDDGNLNVTIRNSWGIIDRYGNTVVPIRYSCTIPNHLDKIYVIDDNHSNCVGVIKDGNEFIPPLYETVYKIGEQYIVGSDLCYDFHRIRKLSQAHVNDIITLKHATFNLYEQDRLYGLLDTYANELIPCEYNCIIFESDFILAGRNGRLFKKENYGVDSSFDGYSGVYDLYNANGELIFGGFNKLIYLNTHKIFLFHFGGYWNCFERYIDEDFCNAKYYLTEFIEGNGRWLILDEHLKTIIGDCNNKLYKFPKGFQGVIERKEENGEEIEYWNIPLDCFIAKEETINKIANTELREIIKNSIFPVKKKID